MLIQEQFGLTKYGDREQLHIFLCDVELETENQGFQLLKLWLTHGKLKRLITSTPLSLWAYDRLADEVSDYFYECYNEDTD